MPNIAFHETQTLRSRGNISWNVQGMHTHMRAPEVCDLPLKSMEGEHALQIAKFPFDFLGSIFDVVPSLVSLDRRLRELRDNNRKG